MVHGITPEGETRFGRIADHARNWQEIWPGSKCKEAGMKADVLFPEKEENIHTNFIREI